MDHGLEVGVLLASHRVGDLDRFSGQLLLRELSFTLLNTASFNPFLVLVKLFSKLCVGIFYNLSMAELKPF